MKTLPGCILVLLITFFPFAFATAQATSGGGAGSGTPGAGATTARYLRNIEVNVKFEQWGKKYNQPAVVDLRRPDLTPPDILGEGTILKIPAAVSTKKNANGKPYGYSVVKMDPGWQWKTIVTHPSGTRVMVTGGAADVEAYWDWVYTGYTKVKPGIDWSQNCNGYTFGVGDWPNTAVEQLDETGMPPLYKRVGGQYAKAKVAVDGLSFQALGAVGNAHSIKVEGIAGSHAPGDPIIHAIIWSSEKFRESPVYEQQSSWPHSVKLNENHRVGAMGFTLLEPN